MAHTRSTNLDRGEIENIRAALIALEDRIYTNIGRKVPGAIDQYEQNLELRKKMDGLLERVNLEGGARRPQVHAGPLPNPAGNINAPSSYSKRGGHPKHLFSTWK